MAGEAGASGVAGVAGTSGVAGVAGKAGAGGATVGTAGEAGASGAGGAAGAAGKAEVAQAAGTGKQTQEDKMRIIRINNQYSCAECPSIQCKDLNQWFLNGKLHRYLLPAVETKYTKLYFWRGILISRNIAEGKLSPKEILKIDNMESRQAAMEIIGYEKFFSSAVELDRYTPDRFVKKYPIKTNPMYSLYLLKTGKDEQNDDVKILMMVDPSKFPCVKYFIRVHPDELNCKSAVARSYGYKTWEEFIENKEWV